MAKLTTAFGFARMDHIERRIATIVRIILGYSLMGNTIIFMTDFEDIISRKHLLSEIDELMQSPWFNHGKDDDMITHYGYVERKEAVEVVRDLCVKTEPPVNLKPRTGKWIKDNGLYRCSACNDLCTVAGWDIPEKQMYKAFTFCPRCGAKMEGET